MKSRRLLFAVLVSLSICLTGAVIAKDDHNVAFEALRKGEILPLSRILAITAERMPGDIIKVELDSKRLQYKLKVLAPDGRMRKVRVDARDGSTISIDKDD